MLKCKWSFIFQTWFAIFLFERLITELTSKLHNLIGWGEGRTEIETEIGQAAEVFINNNKQLGR